MVHSANDFRSHVARSATGLFRVAFFLLASHSKICDSKISILFKNKILRFEVSMDDSFWVDVLQTQNNAACNEFWITESYTGLFLSEELVEAEMVPQISSPEILHDHVEILSILEGWDHVDDEGVG